MLRDWHATYETNLGSKVTRVRSVFNNLLGSDGEKVLRLKAAETLHILPFVMDVCRSHRDQLQEHVDASALLGAGDALLLYGCAEARTTEVVAGRALRANGLLRRPQLPE